MGSSHWAIYKALWEYCYCTPNIPPKQLAFQHLYALLTIRLAAAPSQTQNPFDFQSARLGWQPLANAMKHECWGIQACSSQTLWIADDHINLMCCVWLCTSKTDKNRMQTAVRICAKVCNMWAVYVCRGKKNNNKDSVQIGSMARSRSRDLGTFVSEAKICFWVITVNLTRHWNTRPNRGCVTWLPTPAECWYGSVGHVTVLRD